MSFQVQSELRPAAAGLDGTTVVLENSAGTARAEIWPAFGFNCYRWRVGAEERALNLLYADPKHFADNRPTRCGIPILFPFPNRIRNGRFIWNSKEYELPVNDPSGQNAIHGFACRHPWRVVGQGADARSAWVTGEFRGSVDAPETRPRWPADYRLRVTYRLQERGLRIEAAVDNPDRVPLPFGLGYHPYFRIPLTAMGGAGEDCWVQAGARQYWELERSLPTGKRLPVDSSWDLTKPRHFSELQMDDVLTDLVDLDRSVGARLPLRGTLRQDPEQARLQLRAAPAFRELVVFTPPHRQAVCLEPYTCATDALNLQAHEVDAGLLVLRPGEQWTGVVEMTV
jgi:aldose 1-epimerase